MSTNSLATKNLTRSKHGIHQPCQSIRDKSIEDENPIDPAIIIEPRRGYAIEAESNE